MIVTINTHIIIIRRRRTRRRRMTRGAPGQRVEEQRTGGPGGRASVPSRTPGEILCLFVLFDVFICAMFYCCSLFVRARLGSCSCRCVCVLVCNLLRSFELARNSWDKRCFLYGGRGRGRFASLRLAEYGWKPHRVFLGQKSLSRASMYWYMREKRRGTVSSNSRFQTELFQQYSANLSLPEDRQGGMEAERWRLRAAPRHDCSAARTSNI